MKIFSLARRKPPVRIGMVMLFCLALLTCLGWGGNDQTSANGSNSNELDRRASGQQRELARIVNNYYARAREISTESRMKSETARGNPIQESNVGREIGPKVIANNAKVLKDLTGLMSQSGGNFSDWVGRVKLEIDDSYVHIIFDPDGIQTRDFWSDEGTRYSGTPLFRFEAWRYETLSPDPARPRFAHAGPLLSSPLGQALGKIDVNRKVKVSGTLVMKGSTPAPAKFLTDSSTNPTFASPFAYVPADLPVFNPQAPNRIIAIFSTISNLETAGGKR